MPQAAQIAKLKEETGGWRARALRFIFAATALGLLPPLVFLVRVKEPLTGPPLYTLLLSLAMFGFCVAGVVRVNRAANYQRWAGLFIAVLLAVVIRLESLGGFSPGESLMLAAAAVLGGVFFGGRAAWALAVAGTLIIALGGVAVNTGLIAASDPALYYNFRQLDTWLRLAVFFLFVTSMLAATVTWLIRNYERELAGREVALARLEEEHAERLRADEQARASEARYQLTAQHMSDVIATLNVDGRWRFFTPSLERVLGLLPAALVGAHYSELFHPDDLATVDALLTAAQTHSAQPTHVRARHHDGTWRWLDLQFDEVPEREARLISMVARDVTNRRAIEQEMRKSETMAEMGALLARVAHDVRNPLFGISATIDAMEARGLAAEPSTGRLIGLMRESVNGVNKLMKDLLDYSRPAPVEMIDQALAPVVKTAVRACLPLAERAGVKLDNAVSQLGMTKMEASRIAQVLQNLIENAVQHSPRGESVRIEAAEVDGRAAVMLRVLDRGKGIAAEDLPRLFEPFFTRRQGGTGLGLSIVQRIVEDHGGSIAASHRAGGGTEMAVMLPRTPPGKARAS